MSRPLTIAERERHDASTMARRFAAGDAWAFDQAIRDYYPLITRRVGYLLTQPGDVDDVVQEVFLRAIERHGQFRGESSLETWLSRIAVNCCRIHWRRQRLSRMMPFRWGRDRHASANNDPAPASDFDERHVRVRQAVKRLPAAYREVIILYYLEEMSCHQVAQLLNLRQEAVRQRLVRARKRLHSFLQDWISDGNHA